MFDLRTTALTAVTLQLCGCIFLYEEAPSGSGAGGSGGAGATNTIATGVGGGQGGAGGEGGQGGGGECNNDVLHCGPSGKNCEGGACVCGVCQGFEVLNGTGDGLVNGPIGFGGSTLAYISAPRICFLTEASTTPKCVAGATSTDAAGTHLAVSSIGEAFYSSQNANGAYPVQRCTRDTPCAPVAATTTIQAGHLNGLTIASLAGTEQLLGVDAGSGKLWRLNVTLDLSLTPELIVSQNGVPVPALHDLAQRGNLFVASNQELPPCLSTLKDMDLATLKDGIPNQQADCTLQPLGMLPQTGEQILGLAIGADQNIFVRARTKVMQSAAFELKTLWMNGGEATSFGPPAPDHLGNGDAIATDDKYVYFFAQPLDEALRLFRCDPSETNLMIQCKPMSGPVSGTGAIAVGDKYVHYTSTFGPGADMKLYRAVRQP